MDQVEIVAKTFYETMYPGQKWDQVHRKSDVRAMMLVAAQKCILLLSPPEVNGDLFGAVVAKDEIGDWPLDFRNQFWSPYPHKVGKADAMKALEVVSKSKNRPSWATVMAGLDRYLHKTDDRPWCNPATWIRGHRWLDEPAAHVHNGRNRNGFANIAMLDD